MRALGLAAFGWLVPGGAYLLMRRYLQFAVFAVLVSDLLKWPAFLSRPRKDDEPWSCSGSAG
jgi:hypothetical protein